MKAKTSSYTHKTIEKYLKVQASSGTFLHVNYAWLADQESNEILFNKKGHYTGNKVIIYGI